MIFQPFSFINQEVATSVLWTPAEITTFAWYDAADATTFTLSGTAVDQWNDKSGNDYHMSGSGATRPNRSGSLNGEGVVFYDGAGLGQNLRSGLIPYSATGDTSLYVVGNRTGKANLWNVVAILNRASASSRTMLFDFTTINGKWGIYNEAPYASPTGSVGASYEICEVLANYTANNCNFYQNGVYQGVAGTVQGTTPFTSAASFLGNDEYGSGLAGNLAEVLFFNYKNSDSEREKIEGYLAWKWGLEANLPSGHPYKNSPPLA